MPRLPIDWKLIQMRFENGESAYAISQALNGRPSKQGIAKRAKREAWKSDKGSALTVAEQLPIVQRARLLTGPTKATAERVAFVLELVSSGSTEKLAATAAGINPKTLARWKEQDPQLAEQLRQARAGKLAEWIGHIDQAAQRDWKAADKLLSQAPEAEEWSSQQQGGITIVLNIDRDPLKTVIQGN